jgi:hypothetical protein
MRYINHVITASTAALGAIALSLTAHAIQLADGTVYFENPPRLVDSSILEQAVADSNVKYYFHLSVPDDAGEALQRVEIVQQNGDLFTREVEFEAEESTAYTGHRPRRGDDITIGSALFDENSQTMTLIFDPPVPPGTDLTVRLNAERNPRRAGVYLFGVTAYPEGDIAYGQFLGYGRFHIYNNGSDFFSNFSH